MNLRQLVWVVVRIVSLYSIVIALTELAKGLMLKFSLIQVVHYAPEDYGWAFVLQFITGLGIYFYTPHIVSLIFKGMDAGKDMAKE